MRKPELVLSNTTSFFIGGLPATIATAKKYGFKHLEIIPYRWTRPEEIIKLTQKAGLNITGIHMPVWWNKSLWQQISRQKLFLDKFFALIWDFYMGDAKNSPGLELAGKLETQRPYLLLHAHLLDDIGDQFNALTEKFHVVVENLPYHKNFPRFYWDPVALKAEILKRGRGGDLVLDLGHFNQNLKSWPATPNIREIYEKTRPEIIHISYNSHFIHLLPDEREQTELKELLKIHQPKYITIETNPLVSVKKGKALLDRIIAETVG